MDGVCIKIGLIFPVALQEAIKNLKLRCWCHWLAFISRVALTREGEREGVRTGRKREQHLKSFPTAIALLLSPSRRITKRGRRRGGGLLEKIRSFKRGAKAVAFNGETGKYIDKK